MALIWLVIHLPRTTLILLSLPWSVYLLSRMMETVWIVLFIMRISLLRTSRAQHTLRYLTMASSILIPFCQCSVIHLIQAFSFRWNMQCLYMVICVIIRINLHMAKTLSVRIPFLSFESHCSLHLCARYISINHWSRLIILFVAEIRISLLCEGCRLYTVALLHDGIRINFYPRRNSLGPIGHHLLLCVVFWLRILHLLIKRLWRNLRLIILIKDMLLVVVVIRSLRLSWSHMVISFLLMCVFKHRITLIPKVLYFLRYGALFHRMVLVFTCNVLGIFYIDFCLGFHVGHLPICSLFLARPWRLILILLW